jgi:hypothetical protein
MLQGVQKPLDITPFVSHRRLRDSDNKSLDCWLQFRFPFNGGCQNLSDCGSASLWDENYRVAFNFMPAS